MKENIYKKQADGTYYLTEHWRDVRHQRLEIDNFECRICGSQEQLHVHHKPDAYNRFYHEDPEKDLTTLCNECHDIVTNMLRERRYKKKQIKTEPYKNSMIREEKQDVEKKIKVSPYRNCSPAAAQRTTSRPIE
jgi:5-methylcytosine-specific restriction endonuclease McrA